MTKRSPIARGLRATWASNLPRPDPRATTRHVLVKGKDKSVLGGGGGGGGETAYPVCARSGSPALPGFVPERGGGFSPIQSSVCLLTKNFTKVKGGRLHHQGICHVDITWTNLDQ